MGFYVVETLEREITFMAHVKSKEQAILLANKRLVLHSRYINVSLEPEEVESYWMPATRSNENAWCNYRDRTYDCHILDEDMMNTFNSGKEHHIITIDGPSAAGKTTMAKKLAKIMTEMTDEPYYYLNTGMLYRAIAFDLDRSNNELSQEYLQKLDLKVVYEQDYTQHVLLSGENITEYLSSNKISMLASDISKVPFVREYLTDIMRKIGTEYSVVAEGRDTGTVVFPEADIKFFLHAELTTRANRRMEQLKDTSRSIDEYIMELKNRDDQDSNREIAPLKAAVDAIEIDNTEMSPSAVLQKMLDEIFYVDHLTEGLV